LDQQEVDTMPEANMDDRMKAIERLILLFRMERFVHLGTTTLSLCMLLGSAGFLIFKSKADPATLAMLFGSSGLITYSANRLLKMWDQAVRIVAGPEEAGARSNG
jgi:hypothetical protein